MKIRHLAGVANCVGTIVGFGGSAFAGEYTGNDTDTPIQTRHVANSACAFSGLDQPDDGDNPEDHGDEPGDDENWAMTPAKGRVQSPGQIVAAMGPDNPFAPAGTPGQACRGGGGGEH